MSHLPSLPLIFLLCVVWIRGDTNDFNLHLLNDSYAKCLDGSPPGYYLRPGIGKYASNYKIHLCGGGWCNTDSACKSRAGTNLGSSTFWPPIANTDQHDYPHQWNLGLYGLLGNDTNNAFANWSSVFIMYCDGSSFTSNRINPVGSLFYRGKAILDAVIYDLLSKGMDKAEHVIVSGTSAGGAATFTHAQHFRDILSINTSVVALPDAGFWFDHPSIQGKRLVMNLFNTGVNTWNTSLAGPNAKCLVHYGPDEAWKCYVAQYVMEFIEVPVFIVQSLYDPAQYGFLQLNCGHNLASCNSTELAIAEKYRNDLQVAVEAVAGKSPNGMFVTACNQHEETCRADDWEGIQVQKTSMSDAFTTWYHKKTPTAAQNMYIDVSWPNNPTCNKKNHGAC